jgi:hypothetical protein
MRHGMFSCDLGSRPGKEGRKNAGSAEEDIRPQQSHRNEQGRQVRSDDRFYARTREGYGLRRAAGVGSLAVCLKRPRRPTPHRPPHLTYVNGAKA